MSDAKSDKWVERINRELDEAVEKHGSMSEYPSYEAQFYDAITKKRKKIAEAASSS